MLDLEAIKQLRPRDSSPAAIAEAADRARAKASELAEAAKAALAGLPKAMLAGASEAEIRATQQAAEMARLGSESAALLAQELDAMLPEARKREAIERIEALSAEAVRASDSALQAWDAGYAEAAKAIRAILLKVVQAQELAQRCHQELDRLVRAGALTKDDAPRPVLPIVARFRMTGDALAKLVQLPSVEGRLYKDEFWRPAEVATSSWRETLEASEKAAEKAKQRAAQEAAAQAELTARLAAMSPDERRAAAGTAAR